MLTSTCWREISLSNTVELTTVTPQKQKICRFKRRLLPVFKNSRGSIACLRAANPVTHLDWAVLFLRTPADCHTEMATYVKTKPPNQGASRDLLCVGRQWNLCQALEFSQTGKKRLKRQIFCFCGVTVVSSTMLEREISCQHVDVNMLHENAAIFFCGETWHYSRWGQSVSDRDFHTCLFFTYDTLLP